MLPALTDLLILTPMETFLPQFPPCLRLGLCTLPAPPAVALVETKKCPGGEPGSGRVVQSSCFSGEADTQTSPSATTCGFAPSPRGHAHPTATASLLLFLFPLLLRHSLWAASAPTSVLCSFLHLYPSLPLWSLYFTQRQGSCARALWRGAGPTPKHSYHQA